MTIYTTPYSYTHPLLGDIEADVSYRIEDPDGVPFARLRGIKVDGRWLSEPLALNSGGWQFVGRPSSIIEQALYVLIFDAACADLGWNAAILKERGYRYVGDGGNDPDGRLVRDIRQTA